jgi:hypothetical protein
MNDFRRHIILEILSTLLHEVLHIFLSKHGCFDCKTAEFAESSRRHGRPFQLILAKVQEVAPRLLGIPLKLDGFHSIAKAWQLMTKLPSRHDITLYNWSNVLLASDYTGDTSDLLERMHHMHSYLPKQLLAEIKFNGKRLLDEQGVLLRIPDKRDAQSAWPESECVYRCDLGFEDMDEKKDDAGPDTRDEKIEQDDKNKDES